MKSNNVKSLKERLIAGDVVIGPFCKIPSPTLIEIFGHAGFDLVVIDMEHGPMNVQTAEDLVRACQLLSVTSVIRVSSNSPDQIQRALDIGAGGVQIPQINSAQEAENAVLAAKFAPEGARGVCPFVRAANYSAINKRDYFTRSNSDNLVILHIEGSDGLENLPEIVMVKGVDIIFLGPYDLSQSLGIPGQVDDPIVTEKMKEAISICLRAGVNVGTFAEDVFTAQKWAKLGVKYINLGTDSSIIYQSCRKIICNFRGETAL
jgi:4-hydroxy-2-oxoheptanedioate aldolase